MFYSKSFSARFFRVERIPGAIYSTEADKPNCTEFGADMAPSLLHRRWYLIWYRYVAPFSMRATQRRVRSNDGGGRHCKFRTFSDAWGDIICIILLSITGRSGRTMAYILIGCCAIWLSEAPVKKHRAIYKVFGHTSGDNKSRTDWPTSNLKKSGAQHVIMSNNKDRK